MNYAVFVFTLLMILVFYIFNFFVLKYEDLRLTVKSYGEKNYSLGDFSQYRIASKNLRKKYWIYKILYLLICIISLFLFTFIFSIIIEIVSNYNFTLIKNNIFTIRQGYLYFMIGSLFMAIIFSFIVPEYVTAFLLKDRFVDFQIYMNLRGENIGSVKSVKVLFIVIFICVYLFTSLSLNWYVRIDDRNIYLNSFFNIFEKKYEYSEITYLRTAEKYMDNNDESHDNPIYIIGLNSEKNKEIKINSDNFDSLSYVQYSNDKINWGRNSDIQSQYNGILEFLSKKSNVPIERRVYIEEFE